MSVRPGAGGRSLAWSAIAGAFTIVACSSGGPAGMADASVLDAASEAAMPADAGSDGDAGSCTAAGLKCRSAAACCPGLSCPAEIGDCCGFQGNACATKVDCCVGGCTSGHCTCQANEQPCMLALDCCSGACDGTKCVCAGNLYCASNADCCQGTCNFATHTCN